MRACIHRGSQEIGGSCVELEYGNRRLVLDLGLPLDADLDSDPPLPKVVGLDTGDPSLVGVVISHSHPDHCGFAKRIHPSVPIFLGEATQRILKEAMFFSSTGADLPAAGYLQDGRPLEIPPFTVTPYLMDHSAYDAYALHVEAGGRRLLYSGDLRGHGRKRGLFERLVAHPPPNVNALVLEGTNLRADSGSAPQLSEQDVEDRCADLFSQTRGMVLATYSGQNIDRLVTLHRAAKRSGRCLVLDLYAAAIAKATHRPTTIPQADWDSIYVFVPLSQRVRVNRTEEYERIRAIRCRRLFPEHLEARAAQLVMTFRASMTRDLERANCLSGAQAVWSMWGGYLQEASGQRLCSWLLEHDIPLTVLHSSGHATIADLQRFAAAVNADQVVPIHTTEPHRYADLYDRVTVHADEKWWAV